MTKHLWPDGATIARETWHFHRNLFQRYGCRILAPGEFSTILKHIKNGNLLPLKLQYKDNESLRIFCYIPKRFGYSGERIFVVASEDGKHLVSAYRPKWIDKRTGHRAWKATNHQ